MRAGRRQSTRSRRRRTLLAGPLHPRAGRPSCRRRLQRRRRRQPRRRRHQPRRTRQQRRQEDSRRSSQWLRPSRLLERRQRCVQGSGAPTSYLPSLRSAGGLSPRRRSSVRPTVAQPGRRNRRVLRASACCSAATSSAAAACAHRRIGARARHLLDCRPRRHRLAVHRRHVLAAPALPRTGEPHGHSRDRCQDRSRDHRGRPPVLDRRRRRDVVQDPVARTVNQNQPARKLLRFVPRASPVMNRPCDSPPFTCARVDGPKRS